MSQDIKHTQEMADALLKRHHEFVTGFECGKIYQMMKTGGEVYGYPVLLDNQKEIGLIAREFGYEITIDPNGVNEKYGWLYGKKALTSGDKK